MIEKQELYCHHCGKYVQFELDVSLNGNHVLECPNCKHEHCRVVNNGKITGERWSSRNGQTYTVSTAVTSSSTTSTYSTYTGNTGGVLRYQQWMNTTATT